MKKIFCAVLIIAFLLPTFSAVLASDDFRQAVSSGITIRDNSRIVSASEQQLRAAKVYELDLSSIPVPEAKSTQGSARDIIRSVCQLQSTTVVEQHTFKTYTTKTLANYIPMCSELTCVQESNNLFYVNYQSTDGKTVSLVYSDAGLHEKNIYDPDTDSMIHETVSVAEVYENFRAGTSYELSDELEDRIRSLVRQKDWDQLAAIDGVEVTVTDNGNIIVEPRPDTLDASQADPS